MGRIGDPVVDEQLVTGGAGGRAEARRRQLAKQRAGAPAGAGCVGVVGVVDADEQVHTGERDSFGHGLTTRAVTSRTH